MTASSTFRGPDERLSLLPGVRDDLEVRTYGLDAVAWSPTAPGPIALDPVGKLALEFFDGNVTVSDLIEDVHQAVGIPASLARDRLLRVLDEFAAAGLLTTTESAAVSVDGVALFSGPQNH